MDYTYSYNTSTTDLSDAEAAGILGGIMAMGAVVWLIGMAVAVFMIIVMWKVFAKAGKKGWYALIPFLNTYTMAEICGIKGWMGIVAPLCSIVPFVGSLAVLAYSIYQSYCLAKVYGKETGFAVGLVLLNPIFMAILGFGDASYLGAGASPAKTTFLASDEAKAGTAPAAGAAAKKDEWVDGKEAK